MKFSKLSVYEMDQYGYGTEHYIDIPIRCSDYLYQRLPSDGSVLHFLTAKEGGYLNMYEMIQRIEEVMYFSPWEQETYIATPSITTFPLFNEVMNVVAPKDAVSINDSDIWYAEAPSSGRTVGYNLFHTEVNASTCGLYQSPAPAVGLDAIYLYRDGNDVLHYAYKFDIYNEAFISGENYDPTALIQPAGADQKHRFFGSVTIDIWYDTTLYKYNCTIDLQGYTKNLTEFWTWLTGKGVGPVYDTDNPTDENPNNTNQGGMGDGYNGSDPIGLPTLPGTDMTAAGSIRLYSMSTADLASMFAYLHSNAPGDSILKWWTNPIQGMVSLHYLPYAVSLKTSGAESIHIAGFDTTVVATPANQWQQINFGYIYAPTNKNTYLDRAPYTRTQIYLPGIGIRDLNTDDVIGKYVFVIYQCDNASGQFVAYVLIGNNTKLSDASVKYSFSGCVAAPFPTSQTNWGNTYIAAATLAAGALAAGVGAASGAAGASAAGASGAAAEGAAAGTGSSITAAGIAGGATNVGTSLSQLAKPSIARSGTVSGTTSLFSVKRPYLILEKPNVQDYADFNKLKGYACGMTLKLGDLKGYTEVERIHLHGIYATAPELNEIESLLRQGVIL